MKKAGVFVLVAFVGVFLWLFLMDDSNANKQEDSDSSAQNKSSLDLGISSEEVSKIAKKLTVS